MFFQVFVCCWTASCLRVGHLPVLRALWCQVAEHVSKNLDSGIKKRVRPVFRMTGITTMSSPSLNMSSKDASTGFPDGWFAAWVVGRRGTCGSHCDTTAHSESFPSAAESRRLSNSEERNDSTSDIPRPCFFGGQLSPRNLRQARELLPIKTPSSSLSPSM